MAERIAEFARFLIREDRSAATIRTYQWALKDFREFLASRGLTGLHQVTRGLLEAWQDRLIAARMRPRSRSLATTAVRQFLKWAGDHEYCDARLANWLATVRVKPLQPKPLPPESLARLQAHYNPLPVGLRPLRDRAMFFYFVTTGARGSASGAGHAATSSGGNGAGASRPDTIVRTVCSRIHTSSHADMCLM